MISKEHEALKNVFMFPWAVICVTLDNAFELKLENSVLISSLLSAGDRETEDDFKEHESLKKLSLMKDNNY